MMYQIKYTNTFKKDVKRAAKRGYDISLLEKAIDLLQETGKLPPEYKPHILSGNYAGKYECHIKPDWLMIWEQNDTYLTLLFLNTGTHSDLF
ncbi:MAG: type II toxin-antitoxin system YafQ family toxin [Prevotellaceae bacterium]|jgi:mRNA interferase YafQ|nr:type II toxin-antitoxin system YafQ family toxin [Prevotellaceae bacterium]